MRDLIDYINKLNHEVSMLIDSFLIWSYCIVDSRLLVNNYANRTPFILDMTSLFMEKSTDVHGLS